MDSRALAELQRELHRQRKAMFQAVAGAEADLGAIAEEREAEFEERAQEERDARLYAVLDDRGKRVIEAIDAALRRLAEGRYGVCTSCEEPIGLARLRALPAALVCIGCARRTEHAAAATYTSGEGPAGVAVVDGDLGLLTDREREASLRELVRDDGRVDMDELRIVCRHGVVHLAGALPSATEHEIVRQLLTDVAGITAIDDRVGVKPLLGERSERVAGAAVLEAPAWSEPASTEDVVEANERGIGYDPPIGPVGEEE